MGTHGFLSFFPSLSSWPAGLAPGVLLVSRCVCGCCVVRWPWGGRGGAQVDDKWRYFFGWSHITHHPSLACRDPAPPHPSHAPPHCTPSTPTLTLIPTASSSQGAAKPKAAKACAAQGPTTEPLPFPHPSSSSPTKEQEPPTNHAEPPKKTTAPPGRGMHPSRGASGARGRPAAGT